MNIQAMRAVLEAKAASVPANPDMVEGLSRAQWADLHNARQAANRKLATFDRLAARLPKAQNAVANLTHQIKLLTAADRAFTTEREELENTVGSIRDWRKQARVQQRIAELGDACRQLHGGLVVANFSHPEIERFLRTNGEPAPATGSTIWTDSRYSALPTLKTRLAQALSELESIEQKIQREAC